MGIFSGNILFVFSDWHSHLHYSVYIVEKTNLKSSQNELNFVNLTFASLD